MEICPDRLPRTARAEQARALGEKVLERSCAIVRRPARRAQATVARLEYDLTVGKSSPAVKRKLPLRPLLEAHLRPVVGQVINAARQGDRNQVAGIQRKTIDSGRSGNSVADVGSQIQIGVAAHAYNRWHTPNPDPVQPERHHSQPRRPLVRIYFKPVGQKRRHLGHRNRPMHKKQIAPPLGDRPTARRQRARFIRISYQKFLHGPLQPAPGLRSFGDVPGGNRITQYPPKYCAALPCRILVARPL